MAVDCVKPVHVAGVEVPSYDPTVHVVRASVPKPALTTLPVWSPWNVSDASVICVPSALSV